MTIVIEVDGKPVAKGRGRVAVVNGRGHIFTPAKTRANENLIKLAAMQVMAGRDPIAGAVSVSIFVYVTPPKTVPKKKLENMLNGVIRPCVKPDLDNFVKQFLDALNAIVFRDDNQVVDLRAAKFYRNKPSMRAEIREFVPLEDLI